jgi:hypothetical protein
MIDFSDQAWINYNRFARSIFCPTFDPEHRTLRWFPGQGDPLDGTAYFARLGGAVTCDEIREALAIQRKHSVSQVNGSVHWWPAGVNCKQSLTRCSQGQGAWAWQYLQQWLGLHADAAGGTLTFAPQGLLTDIDWHDAWIGAFRFDLRWQESSAGSGVTVRNLGSEPFTLRVGLRTPGAGATGTLIWQLQTVGPMEEVTLSGQYAVASQVVGMTDEQIVRVEAAVKCDRDGVLFLPLGEGLCSYTFGGPADMSFVRLLVINATGEAWSDVHVELACPDGWLAEARIPEHWTLPREQTPSATVKLGEVPSLHRAVAPFWIKASPSGVTVPVAANVTASLRARTASGKEIRRTADIVAREVRK